MAADNPHTVNLKSRDSFLQEAVAGGTITPGDVVSYSGTNSEGDVQVSRLNTAGATDVAVALEYGKTGKGIDEDYSAGDQMEFRSPLPGERFYCFIVAGSDDETTDGSDANVSVGDYLQPSGVDGTLETAGSAADASFVAVEAVDNSGAASGNHARIVAEAI